MSRCPLRSMHWISKKRWGLIYQWKCVTFSKNTRISNFMKIRPVGTELFHEDGRTDRHDEANSRLSQFCESAEKAGVTYAPCQLQCLPYTDIQTTPNTYPSRDFPYFLCEQHTTRGQLLQTEHLRRSFMYNHLTTYDVKM